MAKRRVSSDEEDFEDPVEGSPAPKRSRVDEEPEEDASPPRQPEQESVDANNENGNEEGEDKEFEAKYADAIRKSIESKSRNHGRVAESGIIQSLEMHHFMCHPRLSFSFGPQINFIIGHNGSGKSAVLSALTVALGGKAITTGRGSGLKAFIREGQPTSEVSIVLKNDGDEAYKPNIYGKSVVITRRFTKEGSSSYKIKSKDGKVISTKREELSAICDHFNIQVDNPMNILSQDAARQFLSASSPGDKYAFFLKGTQLKQLSEEYDICDENIKRTAKLLENKKEAKEDLAKDVKVAMDRYKGAQKAIDQRKKVKELKREMAWSHVKEKENELDKKIEQIAKVSQRLIPKIESSQSAAEIAFNAATKEVVRLEEKVMDLGNIDDLSTRQREIRDRMKTNKLELMTLKGDERTMATEITRLNELIARYKKQIETETKKLQEDKQAEREDRARKLEDAKKEIEEVETGRSGINDQIREVESEIDSLKRQKDDVEREKNKLQDQAGQLLSEIDLIKKQMENRLNVFGRNMDAILKRIQSTQWDGKTPVGPLGSFLSLRDDRWAPLMRAILSSIMPSFAVTDVRDRSILRRILDDFGNHHCSIVISEEDIFDYSRGEPTPDKLTVLRALNFTDEYVKRVFINNLRIESSYLAPNRLAAQQIVDANRGAVCMSADYARVQSFPEGGSTTTKIHAPRGNDPRARYFTTGDLSEQMKQAQDRGRQTDASFKELADRSERLSKALNEAHLRRNEFHGQARALTTRLQNAKEKLLMLQNAQMEDVPVSISALEESVREVETSKIPILDQFKENAERQKALNELQGPLLLESNAIAEQINDYEAKRTAIQEELQNAVTTRVKANNDLKHWQKKIAEENKKLQELEEDSQNTRAELEKWTGLAEQFCDGDRIENPRPLPEVERLVKSTTAALDNHEKKQGATVEQLEERLKDAKEKYDSVEKDLRDMTNLQKVLKSSLRTRLDRWHDFRRHIALRTKLHFQYHLANRGFFGKILFSHEKEELELKVQTEDLNATQSLDKDPRSLSGGEKSFSTICLLLSLWEAIGCPIRCLDEFDVFMDAVNRKVSMKMMIDTAIASEGKQYILITPQDMSSVSFGPAVRVHRMGDPERGQTTL